MVLATATTITPYDVTAQTLLDRAVRWVDLDELSPWSGLVDRRYWAWRLTDVPNGSMQGLLHPLARAIRRGEVPNKPGHHLFSAIWRATARLAATTGLAESFPRERSFCVSGLVLWDMLCGYEALPAERPDLKEIEPLVSFLIIADEDHARISNHLLAAAAGLFRWHKSTGDSRALAKAQVLLKRVLDWQGSEGWLPEYGGFDPGYQTLALTYLADIYRMDPADDVARAIERALAPLAWCAFPDGSFGGSWGRRGIQLFTPAPFELLAGEFPLAREIARFLRHHWNAEGAQYHAALDELHLVPFLSPLSYARDVALSIDDSMTASLPLLTGGDRRLDLREGGVIFDKRGSSVTCVALQRGGAVLRWHDGKREKGDYGWRSKDSCSTTTHPSSTTAISISGDTVSVTAHACSTSYQLATPLITALVRLLAITVFRWEYPLRLFKRLVAATLFSHRQSVGWGVRRTIHLGDPATVHDELFGSSTDNVTRLSSLATGERMATQGYGDPWRRKGWHCE